MHFASYPKLLQRLRSDTDRGPIALILIQDDIEVPETAQRFMRAGVPVCIGLGPDRPDGLYTHSAPFDVHHPGAMAAAVNALIARVPNVWLIPTWNGDALVWPHGDTRPLPDLFQFLEDEKRDVFGGVELDAYRGPGDGWYVDQQGYHSEKEAIYGGLRTRLGPHCPYTDRRLDRPLAFKTLPDRRVLENRRLTVERENGLHAQWHSSPVGAVISKRVWAWQNAQPRRRNGCLAWQGSKQVLGTHRGMGEAGFVSPGQWV